MAYNDIKFDNFKNETFFVVFTDIIIISIQNLLKTT